MKVKVRTKKDESKEKKGKSKHLSRTSWLPWPYVIAAAIVVGIAVLDALAGTS